MMAGASRMTEADFERLSWHDCHLWGFELHRGEPDEDDWTSGVVFYIDYITEWVCGIDRRASFRVAPARLTFHGVTDLKMAIDWGTSGFQVVPSQVIINRISRELVAEGSPGPALLPLGRRAASDADQGQHRLRGRRVHADASGGARAAAPAEPDAAPAEPDAGPVS
jgi:hypothetical protein